MIEDETTLAVVGQDNTTALTTKPRQRGFWRTVFSPFAFFGDWFSGSFEERIRRYIAEHTVQAAETHDELKFFVETHVSEVLSKEEETLRRWAEKEQETLDALAKAKAEFETHFKEAGDDIQKARAVVLDYERAITEVEREARQKVENLGVELLAELRERQLDAIRLQLENEGELADIVREILAGSENPMEEFPFLVRIKEDSNLQHRSTPLILAAVQARLPVWIWGDSGSGKTTAARKVAETLRLRFRMTSVCPTTSESKLLGFIDGYGNYQTTGFREVYEQGGVYLIDEIDNGHPSILAVLNSALANDMCSFPDGLVKRHPDAVFIAAANTIGHGASREYIGRTSLDATTLDRFVYVRMDIDPALEAAFLGEEWSDDSLVDISAGGIVSSKEWLSFVQDAREACERMGIRHLITPRATLYGDKLRQLGVGRVHLEQMCVWKGLSEGNRDKIRNHLRLGALDWSQAA